MAENFITLSKEIDNLLTNSTTLNREPYAEPTEEEKKPLEKEELEKTTKRVIKDFIAPVVKPEKGDVRMVILAGLPGSFKSSTKKAISNAIAKEIKEETGQELSEKAVATDIDFDAIRPYKKGTAEYTQKYPNNADDLAGDVGVMRDAVLQESCDKGVNTIYDGAFKSAQKMPKIVDSFNKQGFKVDFVYQAVNPEWGRLMTEFRFAKLLKESKENPNGKGVIVRNVSESEYSKIADGSPEVVGLMEEMGNEKTLNPEMVEKFGRTEDRMSMMEPFVGKEINVDSLYVTSKFGKVLYENNFDGKYNGKKVLDVINEEINRPWSKEETKIAKEAVSTILECAKKGYLRESDLKRIKERAIDPCLKKIKADMAQSFLIAKTKDAVSR